MKRILTLTLTIVLCFSLSWTSFAAEIVYVFDENSHITEASEEGLNKQASEIEKSTGVIVAYLDSAYSKDKGLVEYTEKFYKEKFGKKDGILLCETAKQWYIHRAGKAERIFNDSDVEELWKAHSSAQYYSEGAQNYMIKAYEIMQARGVSAPAPAPSGEGDQEGAEANENKDHPPRLVDDGELLTKSEEKDLTEKLNTMSKEQKFDFAIVTVKSLEGKEVQAYADDYYDEKGYGMGTGDDGVMLLIGMDERQSAISTYGFGLTAFTIAGMDYIWDNVTPLLSDGEYYKAFDEFATLGDKYVTQAKTGEPYDTGNLPSAADDITILGLLRILIVALVIGAAIGFFKMRGQKRQLKQVAMKSGASVYKTSMDITKEYDKLLYRNSYRIYKDDDSSSSSGGSGSGAHVSSSGRVHGGSSRGF